MVTGSYPPEACGIGDYTSSLASALYRAGFSVELLHHARWDYSGTMDVIRKLNQRKEALIHFQYPGAGYGHSLGPQLCSLMKSSVITIHEFSIARLPRKLSIIPFTLRAKQVVIPAESEKTVLVQRMPWTRRRIRVIPIGSNIPGLKTPTFRRKNRIAYFGLIMPNKGIEHFIEARYLASSMGYQWEAIVIGKIPERHREYAQRLMETSRSSGIQWVLDQEPEEVSDLLASSAMCYLPFPDGATERRGSLKAACANGLPCITTRSEHTPVQLSDVVKFAAGPREAVQLMAEFMSSPEEASRLSLAGLEYAKRFSWERIAEMHIEMYSELIERTKEESPMRKPIP